MKRCLLSALGALVCAQSAHAMLDSNQNGMSDLWERLYNNGALFDPQNPAHAPAADPDGDGWTNLQEALAGTRPFDANPPAGFLAPAVELIPGVFVYPEPDPNATPSEPLSEDPLEPNPNPPAPTPPPEIIAPDEIVLTWPTLPGKTYQVLISPDLAANSWIPASVQWLGSGNAITYQAEILNSDGTRPGTVFWRVQVGDTDSDGDGLTGWEELLLGLDPSAGQTHPGFSDLWIATHFWQPLMNPAGGWEFDPYGDFNNDGISNLEHYDAGTSPSAPPSPPAQPPSVDFLAAWVAVTGNNLVDANGTPAPPVPGTRQYTVPAGTSALLMIAISSKEYPRWTDPTTRMAFNDILTWDIQLSAGDAIQGQTNVNHHHAHWIAASERTLPGIIPGAVHYQKIQVVTAPSDAALTIDVTITASNIADSNLPSHIAVGLLPVEVAPEMLAVNSDFDEGRIDPATGYAIPDCDDVVGVDQKTGSGNAEITLNAKRDHLDGLFSNDEKVTDDLHKGWFGLNPNLLDDDFWDGAYVTIRKINNDDPDTGVQESGQVRFYAKWGSDNHYGISPYDFGTLQPVNLVSAGVNMRSGEGVYGSTSTIPEDAEFWMEGVRPGKITLEWRYQKDGVDLKHEQTFEVTTQKTREEWRDDLCYQVRLQSSVEGEEFDMNNFDPPAEFISNRKFIDVTYSWYEQTFVQSEDSLIWSGMAKMAGAPVYAALSDAQIGRTVAGPGIGIEIAASELQSALMKGNKDIFLDLAWQHRAYAASGILALKFVDDNDETLGLRAVQMVDWISINKGFWQDSLFKSSIGARELLRREQRFIIDAVYSEIIALELDEIISVLAKNPIPNLPPLGKPFAEVVQTGNLAVFNDRWKWIKADMYPGWTGIDESSLDLGVEISSGLGGYSVSDRLTYSQIDLSSRAGNYSTFPIIAP